MNIGEFDTQMMARAIQLARRGRYGTSPNPRVGCVIARKGAVLAEGWHARAGEAHAEVNALAALPPNGARGATAFVSLEPCAHQGRTGPCADALVAAGVARVVVAMTDPNPLVAGKGIAKLRSAGIRVDVGVLTQQAEALNPGYIRRIQGGVPWVRMKSAMSLDGRTAMASGESYWITGPEARADVQRLRAQSCAIVSGVETVLADDPAFTVRPESFSDDAADPVWRQPLRVILDSQLRTPAKAKLLQGGGPLLLLTGAAHMDSPAAEALRKKGVEVNEVAQGDEGGLMLSAVMAELARRGCNEVMVEAGATVSGAFLRAGLVDEWFIYMAPSLMGSAGRPLMNWAMETMDQRRELEVLDIRAVGRDWRWRCRLADGES